jgi:hypothetical protein
MKRKILLVIGVLALLGLTGLARTRAQSGASTTLSTSYDLTWNTVDGGGVTYLTAGAYTLSGTAGQPDAALWSDGDYRLAGGFWRAPGAAGGGYSIYLPLVLRQLEGLVLRNY